MQGDGNFCLYRGATPLWCSATSEIPVTPNSAWMQPDGNLCLYAPTQSSPIWCSTTNGNPGAYLIVDEAGYVAIYSGTTMIWRVP